jgi:hypothetical protein
MPGFCYLAGFESPTPNPNSQFHNRSPPHAHRPPHGSLRLARPPRATGIIRRVNLFKEESGARRNSEDLQSGGDPMEFLCKESSVQSSASPCLRVSVVNSRRPLWLSVVFSAPSCHCGKSFAPLCLRGVILCELCGEVSG